MARGSGRVTLAAIQRVPEAPFVYFSLSVAVVMITVTISDLLIRFPFHGASDLFDFAMLDVGMLLCWLNWDVYRNLRSGIRHRNTVPG